MESKKGTIELSAAFIIKAVLAVIILILAISFFTDVIPFFSKINIFGKIMILAALFALYGNIIRILLDMGMPGAH